MKILVLIHEYPPVGGGGGQVAEDICVGMLERGHAVTVLTAHLDELAKEENLDGIRILRIPSLRREAFRADLRAMGGYVLSGLWAGYRLIKRWCPDLIHVHFAVPAGALAWALSKLTGVPYVMTVHLGDVPGGVPEKTDTWFKWIKPFTHPIWRDARRVIAVSGYTRQLALKHYGREIEVIPNGVDLDRLQPAGIRVQDPPRIVFAGRMMEQKNPLQIVHTLAQLKDLPWQCVMIGDGPLMNAVRQAIAEHNLQERFTLPGWITHEEVLDWFDRSDILFMPSLSEGMPVVGVQALAKGLAFVVSDIGGFVDLVDHKKNGFLVQLGDQAGFTSALQGYLSESDRLLSARRFSREMAKKFDSSMISDSYENVFTEIISQ
jgi:glycosyltransferase involved in cell wall biosynthesis